MYYQQGNSYKVIHQFFAEGAAAKAKTFVAQHVLFYLKVYQRHSSTTPFHLEYAPYLRKFFQRPNLYPFFLCPETPALTVSKQSNKLLLTPIAILNKTHSFIRVIPFTRLHSWFHLLSVVNTIKHLNALRRRIDFSLSDQRVAVQISKK